MYIPSSFKEEDVSVLKQFIQEHPFGLLLTTDAMGSIQATPIPWVWHPERPLVLLAHMARANEHWKSLEEDASALLVFQGLNNYISPNWYPSKAEHHQVVPTWNYEMVQVRGTIRVISDAQSLQPFVAQLTDQMESQHQPSWSVQDAPADFIARQCQAIVGLECVVESIQGKMKLSQNRNAADKQGVCMGLTQTESPFANPAMAAKIAKT